MKLVVCVLAMSASCSHAVAFDGESTLPVQGHYEVAAAPPPPPPPRVEVRNNKIEIREKIQFDVDAATIKPASFDLMNEIADVIKKHPQIKRIRIEGYASSEGNAEHNRKLSDDRAKSVMKYLGEHGIESKELDAAGYGAAHPIADNTTEEGRERNRRVEFQILEQDVTEKKVEIDPKTGAEKVVEEKHETVKAPDAASPQAANAQPAATTPPSTPGQPKEHN
jgi:OOP family OmpA-OmpF porin